MTERKRGRPRVTVGQWLANRRTREVRDEILRALAAGLPRGGIAELQRGVAAAYGMASSEFYRHLAMCKRTVAQASAMTRDAGITTDAMQAAIDRHKLERHLVDQHITADELERWANRPHLAVVRLARRRATRTP